MTKSTKKRLLWSFVAIIIFFNLSGLRIPSILAIEPELGITEGDSVVYQIKYKVLMNGKTTRETQYLKYTIKSITPGISSTNITGDSYISSMSTFGIPTEENILISMVEAYPKIGNVSFNRSILFYNGNLSS